MCMDVCVCVGICVFWYSERPEEGRGFPEARVTGSWELPGRFSGVLLNCSTISPVHHCISGDRVSLLTRSLFTQLEWLASKSRGSACLCLPCTAITGLCLCSWLFPCVLGSELRSLPTKPSLPCPGLHMLSWYLDFKIILTLTTTILKLVLAYEYLKVIFLWVVEHSVTHQHTVSVPVGSPTLPRLSSTHLVYLFETFL